MNSKKKRKDYHTFGMLMPGRKFSNGNYRFGFNGKENDNEVKGDGDQQDYGFRIYDPRLGKFLSVDPLTTKYPELTPYQFASNTPIQAIDMDGREQRNVTKFDPNDLLLKPITVVKTEQLSYLSNVNLMSAVYKVDAAKQTEHRQVVAERRQKAEEVAKSSGTLSTTDFRQEALSSMSEPEQQFATNPINQGIGLGIAVGTVGIVAAPALKFELSWEVAGEKAVDGCMNVINQELGDEPYDGVSTVLSVLPFKLKSTSAVIEGFGESFHKNGFSMEALKKGTVGTLGNFTSNYIDSKVGKFDPPPPVAVPLKMFKNAIENKAKEVVEGVMTGQ